MKGKEYVRPISSTWYLQRPSWTRFMARELTALFVGGYSIFLLVLVYNAHEEQSFSAFYQSLQSPISLVLHLIALVMVTYHTITWFGLTPMAMPLYQGEERVPPTVVVGGAYAAWLVVSLIVVALVLGMGHS